MNTWAARGSLMKQDWRYSANIDEGGISEVDYDHGLSVWRTFHMSILGAYLDLYMQTDIVLLTEVFEIFAFVFTDCSLAILYCSQTELSK